MGIKSFEEYISMEWRSDDSYEAINESIKMETDVKKAANKIRKADAEFGYKSSDMEVANQVWYMLSSEDRAKIIKAVQEKGESIKGVKGFRKCIEFLSEMINK